MPSISPGRGVPASALPAALALVLVFASVGAVAGGGPAPDAGPAAVSTETRTATPVNQSGGPNLTLLAGPESLSADLDDHETFLAARDGPVLERTDRLQRGETLVLAFRSPRLNRSYAAAEATGTTPRFFEAVNRSNATVSVTTLPGASCERPRIRLQESRVRALVERDGPRFAVALDTGAVSTEGGCDGGLAVPGEYQVTVEIPTENGSRRSTAGFELLQRSGTSVDEPRVRRGGPSLASTLDSAAAIRRASRNGTLVSSRQVVHGEVVTLTVRSSRLARAYANASGPNATVRLLDATAAAGGTLTLVDDSGPRTEDAPVAVPGPGVRTLPNLENDTFHLVVETGRARVRQPDGTARLTDGTGRGLRFALRLPTGDDGEQRYGTEVFVNEPRGRLQIAQNESALPTRDSEVGVISADGRFIARPGTNLAPGWNLTVRVRRPNGTVATQRGQTSGAENPINGPTYPFALGSLSEDDRLEVTLSAANTTLDRVPVAVGARPTLRNATARRVGTASDGATVRFAVTAHYPGPGFVVVRTRDGYAGFEVPGDEPTRVSGTVQVPSVDHREEFRLIAVYDSNGNGVFDGPDSGKTTDQPFRSGDRGLLQTSATLPSPTPTPTVTAPPPGTTIPMTGSGGQPGFGPLATVFGGLTLVALAAGRRRLRDSG
jgi:hypothetical protein